VGPHFFHQRHQNVAQIRVQRLHRINRRAQHGETLGEIADLERAAEEVFQPAARNVHDKPNPEK
jgi:hypothetical protein